MSIESVGWGEGATLSCDGESCDEYMDFPSFKRAVAFKEKEKQRVGGWRTAFRDGTFFDFCPGCVEKFAKGGAGMTLEKAARVVFKKALRCCSEAEVAELRGVVDGVDKFCESVSVGILEGIDEELKKAKETCDAGVTV